MSRGEDFRKLMRELEDYESSEKTCECGCGGSCGCDEDEELEDGFGYNSAKAFAKDDESHLEKMKRVIDSGKGYSELHPYQHEMSEIVKKLDKNLINEISYQEYATDDSKTNKRKINDAINRMNGKLYKVERMLDRNIKLKEAIGAGDGLFWNKTRKNIRKITERLNRINIKMKKLSE